ncbi:MAG: class I SAM-dependent methyltransferase [Solirubrobacteraceae bacterium]|nr:class I SAM-dependent methyltransferase [Solirubrobacteraceae bacterium]
MTVGDWDVAEARLRALERQHDLSPEATTALHDLLQVFATDEHAATTVRDPDVAVDRHVADGLSGLTVDAVSSAERIVDIGTGAGVPALVLAIARPACTVVALDTVGRKVGWVVGVAERLGLSNLVGVHARAEDWPDGLGRHDVVTARAVAPLGVLIEYAGPLLRVGGSLVAWKGALDAEERAAAEVARAALAMGAIDERPVVPWDGARDHRLMVVPKPGPTPKGFPRRVGLARRRPLG